MSSNTAWRRYLLFNIKFKPKKYEPKLILKGDITPKLSPVDTHHTITFIKEVISGIDIFETKLWNKILGGEKFKRKVGHNKIIIDNKESFRLYADKVRSQISFYEDNGIIPINRIGQNERKDLDIGFVLLEQGIYFYRTGHHRLGIARALGIEAVPCRCYLTTQKAVDRVLQRNNDKNWHGALIDYIENLIK